MADWLRLLVTSGLTRENAKKAEDKIMSAKFQKNFQFKLYHDENSKTNANYVGALLGLIT